MKCPNGCGEIVCPEHGDTKELDYYGDDDDLSACFISCGSCVVQYETALGSIIHFCDNPFEKLAALTVDDVEQALKSAAPPAGEDPAKRVPSESS